MPRLGHKKSRNGCRQCKARHVKCDENKPCSSCARHGVQCSLITWDPNASPPAPVRPVGQGRVTKRAASRSRKPSVVSTHSNTPASLPIDYVLNPSPSTATGTSEGESPQSQTDPFPFFTKFTNKADTIQPNYWVRDLELMHHWSTEAYYHLSDRDDTRHMWKVIAPKEAITHTFLMHEILALSALHMAFMQPEQIRAHYALGIHHQDLTIRSVRKMLQNITTENAGAVFATTTLLTISVFASRGIEASFNGDESIDQPIDDLIDIFALISGMTQVLFSAEDVVKQSSFAAMLRIPKEGTSIHPIFQDLLDQVPKLTAFFSDPSLRLSEDARREYLEAVTHIQVVVDYSMQSSLDVRTLRLLFYFPLRLGVPYNARLRQKEPGAMVILMYYAAMLSVSAQEFWFMKGWAERIMRMTLHTIEASWHPIIQWPLGIIEEQGQVSPQESPRSKEPDCQTIMPSKEYISSKMSCEIIVPQYDLPQHWSAGTEE